MCRLLKNGGFSVSFHFDLGELVMNSKRWTSGMMEIVGRRQLAAVAGILILLAPGLKAQAGLIDNFQSYTTGTVAGGATGGAWTALGNADGANIQDESGNKLLTIGASAVGANVNVYRPLPTPIANANTATTVFMRVRPNITTGLNASFGIADTTPADMNAVGHFEAQFRLINNAGNLALEARNAGVFQSLQSGLSTGQWYNVWLVINNSTDKWDAYVNTGVANASAGDLKLSNIGFRNGAAANDLTTIAVFGGAGGVLGESVDDIYIIDGADLTNPTAVVPEPASCVMVLTGLCFFALRKRCIVAGGLSA